MSTPLRVLIVEDSEDDTLLLLRQLQLGGYQVSASMRVETEMALRAALADYTWDIIISDYSMPKFDGLAALSVYKEKDLELPFIIVSGVIGEDIAVSAMKAGAHDYIMKGNLKRLVPAIERELREADVRRERQKAERAKRESEEHFRSVSQSANDAIISADSSGKIIFWNAVASKLFGYTEQEALGQLLTIIVPDEMRKFFSLGADGLSLGSDSSIVGKTVELSGQRKEGTQFPAEFSVSMWKTQEGQYYSSIIRDISARKRSEEERMFLRTKLLETQKMESLGTLAGGIAHDFNNILNIIIGYVSFLKMEDLPQEKREQYTETIVQAASRGTNLVQQILTFAKKKNVQFSMIAVNMLVQEIGRMLSQTIPKTIPITLDLDKTIPPLYADATQIHQAILNICVNARDAMPNGGKIHIKTEQVPGSSIRGITPDKVIYRYVKISISDTGEGMDAETRQRIFEPFFTTKSPDKGTGLGLALVYGAVESHNGIIEVESERFKGSTFVLYLPIRSIQSSTGQPKALDDEEGPAGSGTILIVEDEKPLMTILTGILKSKGYAVLTANDGQSGLDEYQKHRNEIDLLLCDRDLPQVNGLEVIKRARLLNADLKVVLMSGYFSAETKEQLIQERNSVAIEKPIKPAHLLRTVKQLLDTGTLKTKS